VPSASPSPSPAPAPAPAPSSGNDHRTLKLALAIPLSILALLLLLLLLFCCLRVRSHPSRSPFPQPLVLSVLLKFVTPNHVFTLRCCMLVSFRCCVTLLTCSCMIISSVSQMYPFVATRGNIPTLLVHHVSWADVNINALRPLRPRPHPTSLCLRQKRRSGYTTTSTREQFMTKNPAYTAEPVVAPTAGPPTGGTGLGALKTDESIVRPHLNSQPKLNNSNPDPTPGRPCTRICDGYTHGLGGGPVRTRLDAPYRDCHLTCPEGSLLTCAAAGCGGGCGSHCDDAAGHQRHYGGEAGVCHALRSAGASCSVFLQPECVHLLMYCLYSVHFLS